MVWPNFFVIGAQKAGTTSVYEYLRQHPEVYMSPVKEPGYLKDGPGLGLAPGERAVTDRAEYLALFDGVTTERAIGEATASYLQSATSAGRIADVVPGARLVAVLRNPVDRAFSAYSMRVGQGIEDLSFAEAVAAERAGGGGAGGDGRRGRSYLGPGFYARHLGRYLERFPREQLSIHLYEDLSRDPVGLMAEVFGFLGVDASFVPEIAEHNVTRQAVRSETVDRVVRKLPGRSLARRVVPAATWTRARRWVRQRNRRPMEFPAELRRELVEMYRDDILETEAIIGRDLSRWVATRP